MYTGGFNNLEVFMTTKEKNAIIFMLNILTDRAQFKMNGREAIEFSKHWEVIKELFAPEVSASPSTEDVEVTESAH